MDNMEYLLALEQDMSLEEFLLKLVNPMYVKELWADNYYPYAKFQPGDRVFFEGKEYTVAVYSDRGKDYHDIKYILEDYPFTVWEKELDDVNTLNKYAIVTKLTSLIKTIMYLDSEIRVKLSDGTSLAFWIDKENFLRLDIQKEDKEVRFNERQDGCKALTY